MLARSLGCVVLAALPLLASCSGGNAVSEILKPPPLAGSRCSVVRSQAKPLIVEWDANDRAALKTRVGQGLVLVRYEGCELEVLTPAQCRLPGNYTYAATGEVNTDRVRIRSADDLYASVPVGAVKLESTLERKGELNVRLTVVGRLEAAGPPPNAQDLDGPECGRATHFIEALSVGAFDFFAGADAAVGGGGSVAGVGGGARSASTREDIKSGGDPAACQTSAKKDKDPPDRCSALLRVEVVPLRAPAPGCPDGSTWIGKQCVRTAVVTEVKCSRGTHRQGQGCAADVSKQCTRGMHFVEGRGCVPDVAAGGAAAPQYSPEMLKYCELDPEACALPAAPPAASAGGAAASQYSPEMLKLCELDPEACALPAAPPAASAGGTFRAAGREWQAGPGGGHRSWADAKVYCATLALAGGRWRLPTKAEFEALSDSAAPGTPKEGWYWSSTPAGGSSAWGVSFGSGIVDAGDVVGGKGRVRCVR